MKKNILILFALAVLCPLLAKAQSNIFDKYNDKSNVSSVYISKTMLEMQPKIYTKDVNISKVAGQLEAVYIVSTMDNVVRRGMRSDLDDFVKKGKYEVLMKQKGIHSSSSFYVKKKGDKVKELIMITDATNKLSYVHLVGDMTLKDIQQLTSSQRISYHLSTPYYEDILNNVQNLDLSWIDDLGNEIMNQVSMKLAGVSITF
ncbi:DUF4252 domain-containing protein [Bacteroides sp. 519]|uniref:DUF4252 domain-containing protein n=1 Tax=Bacteroides sp. 519 TaxID=2302937 RepID=UPI0013D4AE10|nr:DUF4252 domain-containing protein [Bacteroides sp. 519]NDV57104.1 DUF4252 domain-containing protein [Bacteroides sp. 519]